jgi:hypothetical protein
VKSVVKKDSDEPKDFSRAVENLIADLRGLPTDDNRSRKRKTSNLTSIIDELLVKYRISHDSIEHSIRDQWGSLVGAANAAYSHPLAVERNLLVVLTSHAVVRNELFMHRDSILAKLRKLPGCAEIKGLALRSA